jgi:hypothetical protein
MNFKPISFLYYVRNLYFQKPIILGSFIGLIFNSYSLFFTDWLLLLILSPIIILASTILLFYNPKFFITLMLWFTVIPIVVILIMDAIQIFNI